MKKSSTLRSSLKRRSKEYEVKFDISLETIRELILSQYGSKCRYCDNKTHVRNMVCDHIIPLSMGGDSTINNLQLICGRCNNRKGPLTHDNYKHILNWLNTCEIEVKEYVLRKLARNDSFR